MQLRINLILHLIPSHLFLRSHREGPDPNSFDMIFTWTLFFLMRIEDYFCSTETECLEGSSVSLISVSFMICSLFFPYFFSLFFSLFFSQLTLKPVSVSRFLFLSCFHFWAWFVSLILGCFIRSFHGYRLRCRLLILIWCEYRMKEKNLNPNPLTLINHFPVSSEYDVHDFDERAWSEEGNCFVSLQQHSRLTLLWMSLIFSSSKLRTFEREKILDRQSTLTQMMTDRMNEKGELNLQENFSRDSSFLFSFLSFPFSLFPPFFSLLKVCSIIFFERDTCSRQT